MLTPEGRHALGAQEQHVQILPVKVTSDDKEDVRAAHKKATGGTSRATRPRPRRTVCGKCTRHGGWMRRSGLAHPVGTLHRCKVDTTE